MSVIITTIAATLLIQAGYFMWKLSADHEQPRIGSASAMTVVLGLLGDWRWVTGFVATSLGWVLFVQATALGDITVVQPLMSAGDLVLVILAVVFLKERLVAIEWAGVLVTVLGAVALAWEVEASAVVAYSGFRLALLIAVLAVLSLVCLLANRRSSRPEILLALVVGACFGVGSILTKAFTTAYAGPGSSLLSWKVLIDPLLYAVVASNVAGLVLLQAAFQRGRAAVIVPLQLALANAVTVVAGVAVFSEHITVSRAVGIALIVAGTAMLHLKPEKTQ